MQHEPIVITDALAIRWRHSGRLCKKGAAVSASSSGQQSDLKVSIVGATTRPILRHLDARRLPMLDRFSVLAIVAPQQALAWACGSGRSGTEPAAWSASRRLS